MVRNWFQRYAPRLMAGLTLGALALGAVAPTAAAPFDGQRTTFADSSFSNVWARTDGENVRGGRSWYWGPNPWFDYAEFYRQGLNGLRTVQYFDKARMEINIPGDRSGPQQGVTNGLLVKELVSGRLQLGNDPFDADTRTPADVPVAGNPRNANPVAPSYASFAALATTDNGYRDPQRLGERVSTSLDRSGNLGARSDLAVPESTIVQYNTVTGHNIPQVFWDFMNLQGRIGVNGGVSTGPVVDWLFALGLPISDAYWVRAQVGSEQKDVLVQLFERRVLTYVPSNPAGYKVEMGNVGQHYFQWRYPHLGTPWAAPEPNIPLLYASNIDTGAHWELYQPNYNGGGNRITKGAQETVAYSWRRSWDPAQIRLLVDSRRSGPQFRQIYEFDVNAFYSGDFSPNARVRRISFINGDGQLPPSPDPLSPLGPGSTGDSPIAASEYNASVSPDGTMLAFVSERSGKPEIYLVPFSGRVTSQLTSRGCINETPTWSPDGRSIFWANNCDGDFEISRADIKYDYVDKYGVSASLTNIRQLTNNTSDDRFARVSPDGETMAFSTNRSGNWDIYFLNVADSSETAIMIGASNEEAPTWSSDGNMIAYASDSDGDYEIYTLLFGKPRHQQITDNTAQDRWPLWAQ